MKHLKLYEAFVDSAHYKRMKSMFPDQDFDIFWKDHSQEIIDFVEANQDQMEDIFYNQGLERSAAKKDAKKSVQDQAKMLANLYIDNKDGEALLKLITK